MSNVYSVRASDFDVCLKSDEYSDFLRAVENLYEIIWTADLNLSEEEQNKYFEVLKPFVKHTFGDVTLPVRPISQSMNYNTCILLVGFYWMVPCAKSEGFYDRINVEILIE